MVKEKGLDPGWCGSVVACRPMHQDIIGWIPGRSGDMPRLRAQSLEAGVQEAADQ